MDSMTCLRDRPWSLAPGPTRARHFVATVLGEPTRAQRNADLAALLAWGLSRYRVVPVISSQRVYASARARVYEVRNDPTSAANTMPNARTGTPRPAATSGSTVANNRGR